MNRNYDYQPTDKAKAYVDALIERHRRSREQDQKVELRRMPSPVDPTAA